MLLHNVLELMVCFPCKYIEMYTNGQELKASMLNVLNISHQIFAHENTNVKLDWIEVDESLKHAEFCMDRWNDFASSSCTSS